MGHAAVILARAASARELSLLSMTTSAPLRAAVSANAYPVPLRSGVEHFFISYTSVEAKPTERNEVLNFFYIYIFIKYIYYLVHPVMQMILPF